jgi:hypothetical protein
VNTNKIEAINYWSCPKTLERLCGFLGLIGYYRKFVENYENNVSLLTTLLKKNTFVRNDVVERVFHTLKESMCAMLLVVPSFTKTLSWNVVPLE